MRPPQPAADPRRASSSKRRPPCPPASAPWRLAGRTTAGPNSFALVEWWGDGSLKSTSLENYRYAPGASAVSSHDGKALSREETSMVLHAPCAGGQACVAAEEVGKMLCVAEPALPRDLAKREVGAAQTGEGRTPARPYSAAADRNRGRMDLRSDSNLFLARHRS